MRCRGALSSGAIDLGGYSLTSESAYTAAGGAARVPESVACLLGNTRGYSSVVPYHNKAHGASVMHAMHLVACHSTPGDTIAVIPPYSAMACGSPYTFGATPSIEKHDLRKNNLLLIFLLRDERIRLQKSRSFPESSRLRNLSKAERSESDMVLHIEVRRR